MPPKSYGPGIWARPIIESCCSIIVTEESGWFKWGRIRQQSLPILRLHDSKFTHTLRSGNGRQESTMIQELKP